MILIFISVLLFFIYIIFHIINLNKKQRIADTKKLNELENSFLNLQEKQTILNKKVVFMDEIKIHQNKNVYYIICELSKLQKSFLKKIS